MRWHLKGICRGSLCSKYQVSSKLEILLCILWFFLFLFVKISATSFYDIFLSEQIGWVMAFVLLCTHFAQPKCLKIQCSEGANKMLGTFIWQLILPSVHTWAGHSSIFVATCAGHTLLGTVTWSFISASVYFSETVSLYSVQASAIYNPTSCFELGLWEKHFDKNHEAHKLLGTAGSWCQPSTRTNKQAYLDVNNSSTALLFFNRCATHFQDSWRFLFQ